MDTETHETDVVSVNATDLLGRPLDAKVWTTPNA